MMYDEFLEIANLPEVAITYTVYKTVIEPAYNITLLNKRDFVKSLDLESLFTAEYVAATGVIKAAKVDNERVFINNQSVYDYCKMKDYKPVWMNDAPALQTSDGGIIPVLENQADRFGCRISLEWMINRNIKI